jgi:hypothetical protein
VARQRLHARILTHFPVAQGPEPDARLVEHGADPRELCVPLGLPRPDSCTSAARKSHSVICESLKVT